LGGGLFPSLKSGGPIEAIPNGVKSNRLGWFPSLKSGGPIEAATDSHELLQ